MLKSQLHLLHEVGEDCLQEVIASWKSAFPDAGILALVPEDERLSAVPLVQKVCREIGLPVVGAVFPELVDGGVSGATVCSWSGSTPCRPTCCGTGWTSQARS